MGLGWLTMAPVLSPNRGGEAYTCSAVIRTRKDAGLCEVKAVAGSRLRKKFIIILLHIGAMSTVQRPSIEILLSQCR